MQKEAVNLKEKRGYKLAFGRKKGCNYIKISNIKCHKNCYKDANILDHFLKSKVTVDLWQA